jgi:hypothetical protein
MTPDVFFEEELSRHEASWQEGKGNFLALPEALLLCTENNRPLPPWLRDAVLEQLIAVFRGGRGKGKRGRTGGWAAAAEMAAIHEVRHGWASVGLKMRKSLPSLYGHPPTREGAFAFANEMLRGHSAQGAAETIEKSYEKIERDRKARRAGGSVG